MYERAYTVFVIFDRIHSVRRLIAIAGVPVMTVQEEPSVSDGLNRAIGIYNVKV